MRSRRAEPSHDRAVAEPLLGYPIYIVADGGVVTVTGSIQGGTQTIPQGSIGVFVYSSISGEWSSDRGVGSAGSTGATGATGPAGVTGVTGATGAAAPANAFVQGGNAFGATGVFGLTDANGIKMVTNSNAQFGYFALGGSTSCQWVRRLLRLLVCSVFRPHLAR